MDGTQSCALRNPAEENSLRETQSTSISAMALLIFGATVPQLRAANSDWASLRVLKPGQLIRVELNDAKSCDGVLQALNDGGITEAGGG